MTAQPDTDPEYENKVKVDLPPEPQPSARDVDAREKAQDEARAKANEIATKDPNAERNEPLRAQLEILEGDRDRLRRQLADVEKQITGTLADLGEGPLKRLCFGRYDPGDKDCLEMCPFSEECKSSGELRPEHLSADKTRVEEENEAMMVSARARATAGKA